MSQPPSVGDIDAHIRFLKKWGGGTEQLFVGDIVRYCNIRMPHGRLVTGSFIEKLAGVSLPPNELVPRFIAACVKANAVCDNSHNSNVGQLVKHSDVSSIATTLKAECKQADMIMQRARAILDQVGKSAAQACEVLGDLDVALVSFVFKKPGSEKYDGMESISAQFLKSLVGGGSKPANESEPEADGMGNMVQYSASGVAIATGKATMQNHGFDVGGTVRLKSTTSVSSSDDQMAIAYINEDGSVGLHKVKPDGSADESKVVAVTLDVFIKDWAVATRIELVKDYPKLAFRSQEKVQGGLKCKAIVTLAMFGLQQKLTAEHDDMQFQVRKCPTQRVFLVGDDAKFLKHNLVIVPLTSKISDAAPTVTTATNIVAEVWSEGQAAPDKVWMGAPSGYHSEFFMCRRSDSEANMEVAWATHKVPSCAGGKPSVVKMPVLKNTKMIQSGEELVVHQAKVAPAKRDAKCMLKVDNVKAKKAKA